MIFALHHEDSGDASLSLLTAESPDFVDKEQYNTDHAALQSTLIDLRSELAQLKNYTRGQARTLEDLGRSVNDLVSSETDESSDSASNLQHGHEGFDQAFAEALSDEMSFDQLQGAEAAYEEQRLLTLDSHFSGEPYDADWAPRMEADMQTALEQQEFADSQLIDLACQSSLCRLEVEHDNDGAEQTFLHQFLAMTGFTKTETYYWRETTDNGNVQMTYYISRDGQSLPDLEISN
jgi:hypothetical protein